MRYSIREGDRGYELWENATGIYDWPTAVSGCGHPDRYLGDITPEEALHIFNEVVPASVTEPFMTGDKDCKHAWRPWKFNDNFIQCAHCPAMQKVIKLVPKEYRHG